MKRTINLCDLLEERIGRTATIPATIDIPEVRGEPHDRESPLSSITRTIVGNLDDR